MHYGNPDVHFGKSDCIMGISALNVLFEDFFCLFVCLI